MITIKKLKTLKPDTRLRKYILILQELEDNLIKNSSFNKPYCNLILTEIKNDRYVLEQIRSFTKKEIELRNINNLRHKLMSQLGIEPSEWDFTAPPDSKNELVKTGMNLFLEDIRSPFNLGSLFRSAECFGVNKLYLSENCCAPEHNRAIRTSMGTIEMMQWEVVKSLDNNIPIFALELGGEPINKFKFPKEGICIIGSEEFGVSPNSLKLAEESLGRVSIPMYGRKSSLNVANATSILLQRWSESILES